jgi:hypothetical protein
VRLEAVLHGRAEAQVRAHEDQRGAPGVGHRLAQRAGDRLDVVAVGHLDRLPAVGFEARGLVLGERDLGAGRQRDRVVVVQAHQLAQLQVTGERRGLRRDALHQVAIADDGPGSMVDHRMAVAVVGAGQLRLGDGQSNRVGDALAQRSRGHLDAGRVAPLGVARRAAAPLSELLQVIDGQAVAGHVQQAVEQRRAVACRQHEAVAIGPLRVGGVVLEEARPQDVGHGRRVERQAGVAAVGLLHHVHGQKAQRVYALLV